MDAAGRTRVGYVDVCAQNPTHIRNISKDPVLDLGKPGAFDDNGVVPISVVRNGQELRLYYVGFQIKSDVPYTMLGGLAISRNDGLSFKRLSEQPILPPSSAECYVRTAPFVLRGASLWKLWYLGGNAWIDVEGKKLPTYSLKHLESLDGIKWEDHGQLCLEPQGDEFGFGRPWVFCKDGLLRMFYSIRRRSCGYRLGYAESLDGIRWERQDHRIGLDVQGSGWESDNICYSALIETKYGSYLFYNGNQYGKTGFGFARLEGWH